MLEVRLKDAEAIVKYREDKGTFADFESLAKVPGVDVERVEEEKGRHLIPRQWYSHFPPALPHRFNNVQHG